MQSGARDVLKTLLMAAWTLLQEKKNGIRNYTELLSGSNGYRRPPVRRQKCRAVLYNAHAQAANSIGTELPSGVHCTLVTAPVNTKNKVKQKLLSIFFLKRSNTSEINRLYIPLLHHTIFRFSNL